MVRVYFSIRRSGRKFSYVKKGYGVIEGNDIVVYHDKTEVKRYEDCIRYCRPIPNKPHQFSGSYYLIEEVEIDTGYSYDTREIEVTYDVWYKEI